MASATVRARGWLLIEHRGPWADRIEGTGLTAPLADAVERARSHGLRVQLIRRPGRRRTPPPRQIYVGWSGPFDAAAWDDRQGHPPWLEGRELDDDEELAGLDLRAAGSGRPPAFGSRVAGPILLVCVNGKRNVCCARHGVPLARGLQARFGDAVWETTHVGGDRYAANLVCLPHGLYYGALSPEQAISSAEAYYRDEISLNRYRGKAGVPEPAQAAEHFIRIHTGALKVDDVRMGRLFYAATDEAVCMVQVGVGDARYQVVVQRRPLEQCGPGCLEETHTYLLQEISALHEAVPV
ncbi:sucrase ferredoxin [Actinomadura sp. KC06]|nr:sucrase ferredoxin [Actinomadura sp. KC06]